MLTETGRNLDTIFIAVTGAIMAVVFAVAPFVHTRPSAGDSVLGSGARIRANLPDHHARRGEAAEGNPALLGAHVHSRLRKQSRLLVAEDGIAIGQQQTEHPPAAETAASPRTPAAQ